MEIDKGILKFLKGEIEFIIDVFGANDKNTFHCYVFCTTENN